MQNVKTSMGWGAWVTFIGAAYSEASKGHFNTAAVLVVSPLLVSAVVHLAALAFARIREL